MNSIFGGDFGARIDMNLREDKHWSYGAVTQLLGARGQQPFFAWAPVQADKTKESLDELNKEFRSIVKDRPPTAAELRRAQDSMTLKLPGSRETLDEVESRFAIGSSLGCQTTTTRASRGKSGRSMCLPRPTPRNRRSVPTASSGVVAGDRAKIEPGIRQFGLGEVKFLDANGNPL